MKTKVDQINKEILDKEERLLNKAANFFASVYIPNTVKPETIVNKKAGTPPISYILYGIAGLAAVSGVAINSESTLSKILCFGAAGVSAYGGYKLSANKPASTQATNSNSVNPMSLKNEVSGKVTEYIKGLTNDWETFISAKQADIQNFIKMNISDSEEKNSKISKIYTYEVIDISVSDFAFKVNGLPNDMNLSSSLKKLLDDYKIKVEEAIKLTINKQKERYNSLV